MFRFTMPGCLAATGDLEKSTARGGTAHTQLELARVGLKRQLTDGISQNILHDASGEMAWLALEPGSIDYPKAAYDRFPELQPTNL
jgi:hypothetical protein